ncbi:hypothetical protein KRE40_13375 [Elizabethkingia meningoseptica]|uniref:Uncharacterized protein n=1 Tax=Elizabethkingia meningoseptica TaxID=238 RepID=A0A1V3TZF3_ELIME|nr:MULTISPECIES: hypothetical protein [Elizabethkingia]AQX06638.1 hypothetical protein BBD33_15870 [Elizabethkingia meningoseptica]AQX10897.1 hypothetical protein BBD35_00245 [Elizabethkingia meningoseptica]AQX48686.1 hypothetical protein B5G46_15865 [Elizabethkingia meningoseptica]EJK5328251.1 hypothetical protein [Elizabethkingia meningoseptica]EOR28425.1 hypothetical protein L100_16450 [Elizabethkingia meningoseptica ATCC 13253 = NBRC 12535]
MKNLEYPLFLQFKITTLANDFVAKDKNDKTLAYVRQKMFKLKEDVIVFNDESKSQENFRIRADRWLDFNANYAIEDTRTGTPIGKVGRRGMKSIWKATYTSMDKDGNEDYTIREDNGWVKIWDNMIGELPIIGMFTGYFLNPSYTLTDKNGNKIFQLKKMPSFFGRKFMLQKFADIPEQDESRLILSYMMMVLLERVRG